jgi:hypothetical protein
MTNGLQMEANEEPEQVIEEADGEEQRNKVKNTEYQSLLPELLACFEEWTPPVTEDDDPNQRFLEILTAPIDLNDRWSLSSQASYISEKWKSLKPHVHERYRRRGFRHILIKSTRFYECLVAHRDNQETRERIYQGYADCLKYYHQNVRENFTLPVIRQTWFEVLAQYCEEIRQREVEEKQNLLWDEYEFRYFLLYPLYHHEILSPE